VTGAKGDAERDYSFLSSIEILVIDQANVLYMQNWHHLEEILEVMNTIPKHKDMINGLDEIRDYFLDNMSKFYRQNIVFSEFNFPELNALRFRYFENYKGCVHNKLRFSPIFNENLNNFTVEFLKLDLCKFEEDLERRFDLFKNKVKIPSFFFHT
jgi:U3 small nucleolar RNA-associated protein 25